MRVIYHGHACFEVQSKEGIVVFDPYADGSVPGVSMNVIEADIGFASHHHSDHNALDKIQLLNRNMNIRVDKIDTYHDDKLGTLRGKNIIHIVYLEDMKIAHLGDLGCDIDNELLYDCDVFMIPVGGHYTIDSLMAKHIIDKYKPRIVIPMHYSGDGFGYDVISTVDEFLSYYDDVLKVEGKDINIDKNMKNQVIYLKIA